MGSLTRRPVSNLPEISSGQATWINSDIDYDYAIGGLPFLSATNVTRPLVRRTGPYRKEQIDTSPSPGEQSLSTWWLRSQTSFHGGTGIVFEEPGQSDPTAELRFADSAGVNVWKPGQVTLLKQANRQVVTSDTTLITSGNDGTSDCWLQSDGSTLKHVTVGGTATAVTWGGANAIDSLVNDGANYYAADSVGIYKGTLAGGAGSKVWNTGSASVVLGWVKQRLMAGIANKIYELADTSGAPTLPTAKYTHPVSSWVWTAIAESPSAIYAAGYAGTQSAVYKFLLDTSGSVPTLTSGIITAPLPIGEYVTSLFPYLGTYVAIGTNRGVRIATVDSSGDLQYGPLTVDFSKLSGSPGPIMGFTGRDRFIYFTLTNGISGASGLGCIDLATEIGFRLWSWATDLQSHVSGTARGVAVVGTSNQLVFAVDANGSYLEHATDLEPTGYLRTGNIRFHTLEPKLFKYALTRAAAPLAGEIVVSCIAPSGSESTLATYSTTAGQIADEAAFPADLSSQEFVALKFSLSRDSSVHTAGPTFRSYQVKALPGAKRQRLLVLQLLCFDEERDKFGSLLGYEGRAVSRLAALEGLEEAGDLVIFQDLTRDPTENRLCVIDDLQFIQSAPPKNNSGWGGVIQATLRAVT